MSDHRRTHPAIKLAASLLALAFVGYMVLLPAGSALWNSWREPPVSIPLEEMSLAESIRQRVMEVFSAGLFFTLGATIGSFLNVVVYRLPRGESVIRQRSRCPGCKAAILPQDNIPLLGWLLLHGECRSCHTPISVRYPTVEFATGTLFVLLYFVELISGGANLPVRIPNAFHGVVWILFYTKWDLVGIYLYHVCLLSTLLAWALIDHDGHKVPRSSAIATCLCFAVPPLIWPTLLPVPARGLIESPHWMDSLLTMAAGAAAGALLAMAISHRPGLSRPVPDLHGNSTSLVPGIMLLGIALGWQATLETVLILCIIIIAARMVARFQVGATVPFFRFNLFAAGLIHQVLWRWMSLVLPVLYPAT